MIITKAAKLAFIIIILYFTISTLFLIFLKSLSLNQDLTYVLTFVITIFLASHIVVYENLGSNLPTGGNIFSSIQFLESIINLSEVSIPKIHDQDDADTGRPSYMENQSWEHEVEDYVLDHKDISHKTSEAVVEMDDENDVNDDDEDDESYEYEGDSEDNGDSEVDDDFNKKIEEFIAIKKRVWREEIINERLLYS